MKWFNIAPFFGIAASFSIMAIPLLCFVRLFAMLFSRRVRRYVAARPVLHALWFVVSVAMVGLFFRGIVDGVPSDLSNGLTAKRQIDELMAALNAYYNVYGTMPAGGNAQIFKTLCGENQDNTAFFIGPNIKLNEHGEYLDPWKTPYRIDTTDAQYPWIYSFGKNKIDDGGAAGSDDIASWSTHPISRLKAISIARNHVRGSTIGKDFAGLESSASYGPNTKKPGSEVWIVEFKNNTPTVAKGKTLERIIVWVSPEGSVEYSNVHAL